MDESLKHRLVYDRPHIYKCKCGLVQMIFISEHGVEEKTLDIPGNIEYLPCGHAVCCRREDGKCFHCEIQAAIRRPAYRISNDDPA